MPESKADTAPPGGVRQLVVTPERAGQRIDNYLACFLKGVPSSHIYRILRSGEVRVNSARVKPGHRVQAGDRVRIPPVRMAAPSVPGERVVPEPLRRGIEGGILFEDADLIVLDKPSGLAVHGGTGAPWGVIEALREMRSGDAALDLVHRLDRATSGCLMIARRRTALKGLHDALREGGVDKRYLALVAGRWQGRGRRIRAPLSRPRTGQGHGRVQVDPAGRHAETDLRVLRRFGRATLMEVRLRTGRTHQIRVHAAHLGHPLAGDDKYGDFGFNRELRKLGLRRLFLHASELRFRHPESGRAMTVRAHLPEDLTRLLERLDAS